MSSFELLSNFSHILDFELWNFTIVSEKKTPLELRGSRSYFMYVKVFASIHVINICRGKQFTSTQGSICHLLNWAILGLKIYAIARPNPKIFNLNVSCEETGSFSW